MVKVPIKQKTKNPKKKTSEKPFDHVNRFSKM
jgi:hypothetical protein